MTTDIERTRPHTWQSSCLIADSKVCYWQRCIKRKSNDGSGLQIEGILPPLAVGGNQNQNISCEPAWVTIPRISHCLRDSCIMQSSTSRDVLQSEKRDISPRSSLRGSQSGVLLHRRYSIAEFDTLHLCNVTNCSPVSPCVQSQSIQRAWSKKRATSEVSVCRPEDSCDNKSQNEIIRLREALKSERKALRKLHKELEEERCASAAAANEAMAMIRRLQGEKSAALVESRHYKLASEERETYNQEAITLLKEALLVMENEAHTLQEHVEVYRRILLKIKSRQSNQLEGSKEDELLFSLEGKESASLSFVDTNEPLYYSQVGITDVTEDQALGDMMKYRHQLSEVTSRQGPDTYIEGNKSGLETNKIFGTQDVGDISMSILDRVARLEERFACLGHSQGFDSDLADQDSHDMTKNLYESAATRILEQHLSPSFSKSSVKLNEGFATDSHPDLEDLRCLDMGRVAMNSEHSEQEHVTSAYHEGAGLEAFKINIRGYSRSLSREDVGQESTFLDTGDAEVEAVHDVYEVQCDPNGCGMPPCIESCKGLAGSADVIADDSLQVSENKLAERRSSISLKDTIPSNHSEGYNIGKRLPEVRPTDEEPRKSSTATEDVDNLKLRLQALEGERAFMKVAIDSLRKENMELKLLQDIAQQLRELKRDVWKTESKSPGRHEQLPFFSFIKGILSFSRMRSSATMEEKSHLCQESSSCNYLHKEQGLPGLFYLLKYSPKEEGHMCIMRKCNIKLSSVP